MGNDGSGRVVALFVAPAAGAPMERREAVEVTETGLVGDRYVTGEGSFSRWPGPHRAVTVIAAEALREAEAAFGVSLSEGQHRRNVVVAGVDLETLLKQTFRIGGAVFRGERRCAPCRYLVRVTGQEAVFDALRGRGGLRCRVIEPGAIRLGDRIQSATV